MTEALAYRTPVLGPLIRTARPKQWLKNILVAAAPLSAGILLDVSVLLHTLTGIVLFCVASSGVYFINDLLDRGNDKLHPTKRLRPIAAGLVPVPLACGVGLALLVAAPVAAFLTGPPAFAIVLLTYEVVQVAYCLWLKHIVVLDLVIVSSGFLLRAIGGAAVVSILTSQWFLLVAGFGSLFMVAGKRYSEKIKVNQIGGSTRPSLEGYSPAYLRFVWSTSAGIVLVAYSLWAFELGASAEIPFTTYSIVPLTIALLRYAYSIDTGRAGAPEDTVLGDPQLLLMGGLWFALFALAVAFG